MGGEERSPGRRADTQRSSGRPRRHAALRCRRAGGAAARARDVSLCRAGGRGRGAGRWRARARGGRDVLRRMAAVAAGAGVAARSGRRAARVAGAAGPLVAVRDRHCRLRGGMGLAPPTGPALMGLEFGTSVKYLKGVGPKRAEALARLGVRTVGDLLYHAPHRYLDATTVTPLARAAMGREATCVGRVVTTGILPTRRGLRVFRAVLRDDSGLLECAWPGQPFLERQIKPGQLLLVSGPVRFYHGRQLVPRELAAVIEPDR